MKVRMHTFIEDSKGEHRDLYEEFRSLDKVIDFLIMLRESGCKVVHFVLMGDNIQR